MDEPTDNQFKITWEVHRGDIVKIREYDWRTERKVYYYGIVVGDIEMDQLTIFPHVAVYMFKTQKIEFHGPSHIEVVSRA